MKIFQKIKLSLLITLAITTQASAATELTVNVGTASTMSGAQDYDIMHKTGSAALTLSSTGNDIGTLDIQNGTVQISAATNLVPSGTTPVVNFSGSGGTLEMTLVPNDASANTISAIDVTFAPVGTTANGGDLAGANGTIYVDGFCNGTLGSVGSSTYALTVAGAGTLNTDGSTNNSESTTGITVAAGATLGVVAAINLTTATTLNGGTLMPTNTMTIASPITLIADSYINAGSSVAATLSGALTGARTLTANGTGTLVLKYNNISSATILKVNSGIVSVSGSSNIPGGGLTLNGGTLQTATIISSVLHAADPITSFPAIILSAPSILDLYGSSVTQTSGTSGITDSDGNALTLKDTSSAGGGILTLNNTNSGASTSLTIDPNTTLSVASDSNIPGGTLTLAGGTLGISTGYTSSKSITVSANSSISVPSGGTFTYNAASGITGSSVHTLSLVGGGIFALAADQSSNSNTALKVGSDTTLSVSDASYLPGGGLTLAGGTLKATATTDFSSALEIALGAGGGTLDTGSYTTTLNSPLVDTTGRILAKIGSGVLAIGTDTDNTNSKSTIAVNAGTLSIASGGNIPAAITVASEATLATTGSITSIGTRTITMASGSTLELGGGTFAAPLTLTIS